MKVILRKKIAGLGEAGNVKDVKEGYARNFLLPRQMAYPASPGAEKRVAEEQKIKGIKEEKEHRGRLELSDKLKDVSLTIPVTVGEEEQLYGSVSERDIVTVLAAEYQINLDSKSIRLDEPIKHLGVYRVPVKLGPELESTITVWVVKNDGQRQS